ncbi:hypothetical protein BCR43DRAFT_465157 [Syncephalastrum racemosum]|uniref:Uncharacterized protein n=1 Tax=Syncephalastrum racemosum TaxID=13706 RepID=A0A1X2HRK4_SYNRA|nr:hypothetical protein BCR43DRAFT_465157 [Syncephalastrum racemosum]
MIDFNQVFKDKSIQAACEFLDDFCESCHRSSGSALLDYGSSFYQALPTVLTTIFGSPTTRGWVQHEVRPQQAAAIRRTLRPEGPFMKAMIRLSGYPQYGYDMMTDRLPEDVRKALAAGALQFLPRLYTNCTYLDNRSNATSTTDMRVAATRQSTIFPRPFAGEYKVKFNMIQFYFFYVVHVATWPPLPVPTVANATIATSTTTTAATTATTAPASLGRPVQSNPTARTVAPGSITAAPSTVIRTLSIKHSAYNDIIEEYLRYFIPSVAGSRLNDLHADVGPFFADACIELWLRTPWIQTGQALSSEHMHFITCFVRYIAQGDLRRTQRYAGADPVARDYRLIYESVKDELYMLISRLALNWRKQDDYLQVMTLWSIWAQPWYMGHVANLNVEPKSVARPLADGWAPVILENLLYYIPLVEIFLQRIAQFDFTSAPAPAPLVGMRPLNTQPMTSTTEGQLAILHRLVHVFRAEGLMDFLAMLEAGLVRVRGEYLGAPPLAIPEPEGESLDARLGRYFSSQKSNMDEVWSRLKKTYDQLVQLGGGSWNPPHLYITGATEAQRADACVKTLQAVFQGSLKSQASKTATWGQPDIRTRGIVSNVVKGHTEDLKKATELFARVFSLPMPTHAPPATAKPKTSLLSSFQKSNKDTKPNLRDQFMAGLHNGGYLTPEEKERIKKGQMLFSYSNIPTLGPRKDEVVHSYELAWMVRWIVPFDRWRNRHYQRWVPDMLRKRMWDELSVRYLARPVNLIYAIGFVVLLICICLR